MATSPGVPHVAQYRSPADGAIFAAAEDALQLGWARDLRASPVSSGLARWRSPKKRVFTKKRIGGLAHALPKKGGLDESMAMF